MAPITSPRANAHIHLPPNFSAFDTVAQAVGLAHDQGVSVLGASNYYDYGVYAEFDALCESRGIYALYGIEIIALLDDLQAAGLKINDPGNPGKMYLCGKGITRFGEKMTDEGSRLLATIRDKDSARMAEMTTKLATVFAKAGFETGLDEAAVKQRIVNRHGSDPTSVYLQERHLAQSFQERLFELVKEDQRAEALASVLGAPAKSPNDPVGVQGEIRSHLMKTGKAAYVPETFVDFDHAYRLVLELGGIPCYPTLADGAQPICGFEEPVESLVERMQERGIHMAELIPIRNEPEVLERYVTAIRAAGIPITAGTEHNTLDLLPIDPQCIHGQPIREYLRQIFWEGACVVAAHQQCVATGNPGFVDEDGKPNPAYANAEERIAAFSALGAKFIEENTN